MTTELVMLRAIERGLPLSEFENMTFGMITDFVVSYNNDHLKEEEKESGVVMARQADFDRY